MVLSKAKREYFASPSMAFTRMTSLPCSMPKALPHVRATIAANLMERLGHTATARASFSIYNTMEDVERFCSSLKRAANILG